MASVQPSRLSFSKNFTSSLSITGVKFTDRELGRGSDAVVVEADHQGTLCAVKNLHQNLLDDQSPGGAQRLVTNFENEITTWHALRHPHIVLLLGVHFEKGSRIPALILEKMQSSLRRYIETYKKEEVPLPDKVFILRQVSQALAYLHSLQPSLVHHDLSPNNILLNQDSLLTKITDFGMSRAVDPSHSTRKSSVKGTLAFMPPEALASPPKYTEKLDIFSFGNITLFAITHLWPEPGPPVVQEDDKVIGFLELQRREQCTKNLTAEEHLSFFAMIQSCLENRPDRRPTSLQLVQQMRQIEKAHHRRDLTQQLKEKDSQLKDKDTQLKEQDDQLKKTDDQLKEKDDQLKGKDDQLKERDEQLKEKDEQLKKQDDQLKKKDDQLKKKDDQLKEKNGETVKPKDGENQKLCQENQRLPQEEYDILKCRLDGLQSASGQVQEPIKHQPGQLQPETLQQEQHKQKQLQQKQLQQEQLQQEQLHQEQLQQELLQQEQLQQEQLQQEQLQQEQPQQEQLPQQRKSIFRRFTDIFRSTPLDQEVSSSPALPHSSSKPPPRNWRELKCQKTLECDRMCWSIAVQGDVVCVGVVERVLLFSKTSGAQVREFRLDQIKDQSPVWGVAFIDEDTIVVSADRRLRTYTTKGQLLCTFHSGKAGFDSRGLTVGPDRRIFVCDYGNDCVCVFHVDGKLLSSFGLKGSHCGVRKVTGNWLWDVCMDGEGLLFISDRDNSRIWVHSVEGAFIREFSTFRKPWPWCVAATHNNHLVVSSKLSHTIMIMTTSGQLVHEFGGEGIGPGQFFSPTGVAVDNEDCVYVCDSGNNRVQVY